MSKYRAALSGGQAGLQVINNIKKQKSPYLEGSKEDRVWTKAYYNMIEMEFQRIISNK